MRRMLLLGIVSIFLPITSGADPFDDGLIHDVDFTLLGISVIRDSMGGAPTTVNMRSGADATLGALEVEDSSVLNVFDGAVVDSPDYFFTSSGAICGGSIAIQNLFGGTLTIIGTSFDLGFGPVAPGGIYNGHP